MDRAARPTLWIVHRDASRRTALARLYAGPVLAEGTPDADAFADATPPDLVLLGIPRECEAELEFAHRVAPQLPDTRWLLVAEPEAGASAALFDTLPAATLHWPPSPAALAARAAELGSRLPASLSARRRRDRLAERFTLYFDDLELPELLQALDPRPGAPPLVIGGEAGTGRGLLARYVHHFAGGEPHAFRAADGAALDGEAALREAFRTGEPRPASATLCVENVDALPPALQRTLAEWIELGLPGPAPAAELRWIVTTGDPLDATREETLAPGLAEALAGLRVRIPPLRERLGAATRIAEAELARFAELRREPPAALSPETAQALEAHPWPGNARALEATLARALARGVRSPIAPDELELAPARDASDRRAFGSEATDLRPERVEAPDAWTREPEKTSAPTPEPEGANTSAPTPGNERSAAPAPDTELLDALATELRAPLADARQQAERLTRPGADAGERELAGRALEGDLLHIERTVARTQSLAGIADEAPGVVDVTALFEAELESQRRLVSAKRLLVLRELERAHPHAYCARETLALALHALLEHVLARVPERGDVYLASRHHPEDDSGPAQLRVVLRFHCPEAAAPSLALLQARLAAERAGGHLREASGPASEGVLVLELPAADAS